MLSGQGAHLFQPVLAAAAPAFKQHRFTGQLQLPSLVSRVQGLQQARIDVVLDNAGFELVTDLLLAHYLCERGVAATVVLHGKALPWFVSDVTESDLSWVLDQLHRSESEMFCIALEAHAAAVFALTVGLWTLTHALPTRHNLVPSCG